MAEAAKKFVKQEVALIQKALNVMRAQIVRAKVKEAGDADMVAIYEKRLVEIDALMRDVGSKELF